MNIVMLGAAIGHIGFSETEITEAIRDIFSRKGEAIVDSNLRALQAGIQTQNSN